jgi:hypothetical protein
MPSRILKNALAKGASAASGRFRRADGLSFSGLLLSQEICRNFASDAHCGLE